MINKIRATVLAAFMALLVAMLPGPAAQHAPDRAASLGVPVAMLSALNGRAHLSRQDAVQLQPVAGLPPLGYALPAPPQTWHLADRSETRLLLRAVRMAVPLARGPPLSFVIS